MVSEKHLEWLEIIPLVNLLRKRNLQSGGLHEEDPKRISWNTVMNLHGTRLDILRTRTHPGYADYFSKPALLIESLLHRFFEKNYERLLDLFQYDPVLLQVFIILCPYDDLSVLITKIHPNHSLSWFTHIASEIEKMSVADVSGIFYYNTIHYNCYLLTGQKMVSLVGSALP